MSEPISVPPDLKQKFANFDGFSNLVSEQRRILDDIHRMNEDAGGHGDEVATKYHEYTTKGTENVSGLVEQIAGYLGLTGESGHVTASTFDATEDGNQQLTTGWTPTPTNVGRPGH
ncbi:hypothetical protein [Amycolatopsis samaneae]|uniref:Excreted virulence factor EspC, type VII ESX diderm n=1 Tax=Amycolatopsis samaneae TaxID=664691 RepID=A0ABW5GLW3_9PSEU